MIYTSTVTKTGQVFLPKAVRLALGLEPGSRVSINLKKDTIAIERKKTLEYVENTLEKLRASLPESAKEKIRQNRGKTAGEIREEWLKSEESTKYYGEKYGIKVR